MKCYKVIKHNGNIQYVYIVGEQSREGVVKSIRFDTDDNIADIVFEDDSYGYLMNVDFAYYKEIK